MFVLPILVLAFGWIGWDFRTGALAALGTLIILFVLAGVLVSTVKDPSWIAVGMPFSFAVVYTLVPDFIAGQFDDAAVIAAGALLTFGLWLRKQPDAPKWIVFPLLFSALYTLFGGMFPGPVDELFVTAITTGASVAGASRRKLPRVTDAQVIEAANPVGEVLDVQEE